MYHPIIIWHPYLNVAEIIKTICSSVPKVRTVETITIEKINIPDPWLISRKVMH